MDKCVGIASLFVVLIWLVKATFNVILMVLAAALIALFFHGFAALIKRLMSWVIIIRTN